MDPSKATETEQLSPHPSINKKKKKKKALLPMAEENPCAAKTSPSSSSSSSTPRDYSNITQMNHDHVISILQLLPVESILSFSVTCRKFRFLASSDTVWESICRREWGEGAVNSLLASLPQERRGMPWKWLYQQVSQLDSLSCIRLPCKDGIFPKPRASHSMNFVSDCLVLFGGGCEGGRHLDDTWVAYVGNNAQKFVSWQQVTSGTPSGRFAQTCTVIGSSLILFGGINDNGLRQNDTWIGQVTCNESFEIKLSWKLLEVGSVAPPPRGAHAGCCIGDSRIVIHGGIGLDGLRLNDMWMLELVNGLRSARWHQIMTSQPSPSARSGHTLTWVGKDCIILFGGRGTGYEVLNDVWLFDLAGEYPGWIEVRYDCPNITSRVPLPRVGHSATLVLGGRVLIYGGEDSLRRRMCDFWLLDLNAIPKVATMFQTVNSKHQLGKVWRPLKVEGHLPNCRSFHAACTDQSGYHVYAFGGMVDGASHPPEAYGLRFDGELYLVEFALRL